MAEKPEENPSIFLMDDSFAAFCYDQHTVIALESAFNGDPDPEACKKWHLSPSQWRENIEMAKIALSSGK
jgi:hypothetical protein